jgi:hypothetical protein
MDVITGGTENETRPLLGESLVESIEVPETRFNLLFSSLLLTSIGVFLFGNTLVLFNAEIFKYSVCITAVCIEILAVFYLISRTQRSPLAGLLGTYLLLWFTAYTHRFGLSLAFHGVAIFAILYTARFLRINRPSILPMLAMSLIGTLTVLGTKSAYTSFCIIANLNLGWIHQDTLFLSSIAAMIKNYGIQSTGLHGLVEIDYHTFSIALIAGISGLSGQGVLECYGVAPWVLFAPMVVFSFGCCSAMLDRYDRVNLPRGWIMTCLLLTLVPLLFANWSLDDFFGAESQSIAIGMFMLGLPLLFKRKLAPKEWVIAIVLAYILSKTKGPVGIMWGILWLTRLIFIKESKGIQGLIGTAMVCSAIYLSTLGVVKASQGIIHLSPFHHIAKYVYGGERLAIFLEDFQNRGNWSVIGLVQSLLIIGCFALVHYLFSWWIIVKILRQGGVAGIFRTPIGLYLLALTCASLGVICLFQVGSGNEGNFSVCAFFVSLPVVAVYFYPESTGRVNRNHGDRTSSFVLFAGTIVAIIVLISFPAYREKSYFSVSWHYFKGKSNAMIEELRSLRKLAPLTNILEAAAELKSENPVKYCSARPFVFPAVSERPWTGILHNSEEDCPYKGYGYIHYGVTSSGDDVSIPILVPEGMTIQAAGMQ